MKKVAITGGPSTGKSLVCRFFQNLGAHVTSADEIVHELIETQLKDEVIQLLGKEILSHDHIDRAKIAKKVFNNQKLLSALEAIIHPAVYEEIQNQYNQLSKNDPRPLFVCEVPLLFEAGWEGYFDFAILVVANEATCMKRTPFEDYQQRVDRLLPEKEKRLKTHFVIENSETKENLSRTVAEVYHQLVNAN